MTRFHNISIDDNGIWAKYLLYPLPYGWSAPDIKEQALFEHEALQEIMVTGSKIVSFHTPESMENLIDNCFSSPQERNNYPQSLGSSLDIIELLHNPEKMPDIGVEGYPTQRMYVYAHPLKLKVSTGETVSDQIFKNIDATNEKKTPVYLSDEEIIVKEEEIFSLLSSQCPTFRACRLDENTRQWIWNHCLTRGVGVSSPPKMSATILQPASQPWLKGLIDEGAYTDYQQSFITKILPRFSPINKIIHDNGNWGYQSHIVIETVPANIRVFPHQTEYLSRLDTLGFFIDWTISYRKINPEIAKKEYENKYKRVKSALKDSKSQSALAKTLRNKLIDLANVAEDLSEETSTLLAENIIITVAAKTAKECLRRREKVISFLKKIRISVSKQKGIQKALYWHSSDNAYVPAIQNSYSLTGNSISIAALVPVTDAPLGDPTGPILGENRSNKHNTPFRMDPRATIESDDSASIFFGGKTGGGKTVSAKIVAYECYLLRGGQVIAQDSSIMTDPDDPGAIVGEYELYARRISPQSYAIIDLSNPTFTLDPLRTGAAENRINQALNLYSQLLHLQPGSPEESEIRRYLNEQNPQNSWDVAHYYTHTYSTSLGNKAFDNLTIGEIIAIKFSAWLTDPMTEIFFNTTLQPLTFTEKVIVLRTHKIDIPTETDLERYLNGADVSPGINLGMTIIKQMTYLVKEHAFSTPYPVFFLNDECRITLRDPSLKTTAEQFITQGRKSGAAIGLIAQDPAEDIPERDLRQIPIVFIFGVTSNAHANSLINALGIDKTQQKLAKKILINAGKKQSTKIGEKTVNMLPPKLKGVCLVKHNNNYGQIKWFMPVNPEARKAMSTTTIFERKTV